MGKYPDLSVSVEGQETEGDLVRTRLTISGTDEGGVMWYLPTGRADTEELLRQLGQHREGCAGRAPRTSENVQTKLVNGAPPPA